MKPAYNFKHNQKGVEEFKKKLGDISQVDQYLIQLQKVGERDKRA